MPIDPESLPQDPAILQQMLVDLTTQLDKTQRLLRQLLEAKHSTKSEQLSPDQLQLFIEELQRTKAASKDDDELPPPDAGSGQAEGQENSRTRGRRPLPPHLKRQRIEHDLSAEEKHCAGCQQDLHLHRRGDQRALRIHSRAVYCDRRRLQEVRLRLHRQDGHQAAPADRQGSAGASLLAQVIVGKIADHVPLHRQGKIFSRVRRRHSGPDDGRMVAAIRGVARTTLCPIESIRAELRR